MCYRGSIIFKEATLLIGRHLKCSYIDAFLRILSFLNNHISDLLPFL